MHIYRSFFAAFIVNSASAAAELHYLLLHVFAFVFTFFGFCLLYKTCRKIFLCFRLCLKQKKEQRLSPPTAAQPERLLLLLFSLPSAVHTPQKHCFNTLFCLIACWEGEGASCISLTARQLFPQLRLKPSSLLQLLLLLLLLLPLLLLLLLLLHSFKVAAHERAAAYREAGKSLQLCLPRCTAAVQQREQQ